MEDILRKIKFFKETHKPRTPFYMNEKGDFQKGLMKSRICILCSIDLEEIRKNNPRRRVIMFCSGKCEREFNRRKKIKEELGADWLVWNTKNGKEHLPRNEMKAFYVREGKGPLGIPYKAKKSKFS